MSAGDRLLLDTHIWLWMEGGRKELKSGVKELIETAARHGDLMVSVIAAWELALLTSKNRLELDMPVRDWISEALTMPGLRLAPMTPDIAVESCFLPGDFHNDPADRLIVATARLERATIVTRDARIRDYGRSGHVRVLAA